MLNSIILGVICSSLSANVGENILVKKDEKKLAVFKNEIQVEYEKFKDKVFRDDQILVTFDEESSKYIKEHNFFPTEFYNTKFENLNLDKTDLIADLSKFNRELTYTFPSIGKGREKVIEMVNKLEKLSYVSLCEPDFLTNVCFKPSDSLINYQWPIINGLSNINVQNVWDTTKGKKRVRVGVIDTGIYRHPDLIDNLVEGYDFFNDNNVTNDDIDGHGTHVAGIIAARQNSIGISGIAPNVTLVPLQAVNSFGTFYESTKIKAINYATNLWGTENQISVLNFSIGGYGDFSTSKGVLNAAKCFPGIFVWSAGNANSNVDTYSMIDHFNYENIISVGNVDSFLNRYDDPIYGSNYGNNVNIYAPGTYITSTIPVDQDPSDPYDEMIGTSMSAPHVAAAAALIYSECPNLTRNEVKRAIVEGGKDIQIYGGGNKYNAKYLDITNALKKARNISESKYAYLRIGITNKIGDTWSVKLLNDNNESVHVCYNSKMCFGGDGEDFSGLNHIKEIEISANSFRIVEIQEYGSARYIAAAITYSDGNIDKRWISYVMGLSYDSNNGGKTDSVFNNYQTQRLDFPNVSKIPNYLSYSVLKRTGFLFYKYVIRIKNHNNFTVNISYNEKMCFASDAEKFTVNDAKDIEISGNSFADVTIESNGTAGYITSRIKYSKFGFDYSRVTYANGLSKNSIGSHKYANLRYEIGGVYIDEA